MSIHCCILEGPRPGPHLLVTAGIHGDEWEPMVAVRRLAQEMKPELLAGRLTLAPVVNEPAYRRGSRVGDDGLDLARVCPGRADGSATERIAFELAALIRDADFFIDLHTGGALLQLWPLAGYMLHPDPNVLERQRAMARAFGLPLIWGSDPSLEGRSLSVARDAKVPAIYAEYLGSVPFCQAAVDAYVEGCRNVMRSLGMAEGEPAESGVRYVAEDARPGSGHLQACHRAPASGLFRPTTTLGQPILAGEPLGALTVDDGGHDALIPAEASGRVAALRAVARVAVGDSLGVVVEGVKTTGSSTC